MLAASVATGCAGSGVVISDSTNCQAWLDGNGRDAYLHAHGLRGYDSGQQPATANVARALTVICARDPALAVGVALQRAAGAPPPAPPRR